MAKEKKPGAVRAALLNWLGVPIQLTSAEFWREFIGASSSGKSVSVDAALQLSAVMACVRLLSTTVATLPLRVYRTREDGSRELAKDHDLYRLLARRPNSEMTPARFINLVVASILLRGNAFVEKRRVGRRVVSLLPLMPQNMSVRRNAAGRLEYTYTESGTRRMIRESDIMHIRGFGIDGVAGLNPVKFGRDVLGAAMAADEAAGKVFQNGMQSSGFITHNAGLLKNDQRERVRKEVDKFVGSKNAGKLMVLEAGMEYHGITMNPEAAQMLQTRSYNVEEICRWFGVPPFMIGHMDKQSSWASSVESQNLHFLTSCLRPLLVNIEQEILRCLVEDELAGDVFAEFSVEGLLRADSAGRAAYYRFGLQDGWLNRNEVRALENRAPIEGGEIYTVQANLVALEKLGEIGAEAERVRSALRAWLGAVEESAEAADVV
ncbi:phage portal protein [Achromobacter xylosoxidans]|uniref:phage portal protein n=1 Tax=Alcaligenes xylosoxydans xylosoxydans TaxID=85698 RepID=UPI001F14615A|nr:phage portal protein [Achromobacter xylosoxidans]